MSSSDKIETIAGAITLSNGETSSFIISRDGGWQQWGASRERLSKTSDALEAMSQVLMEEELLETSDDDEDF